MVPRQVPSTLSYATGPYGEGAYLWASQLSMAVDPLMVREPGPGRRVEHTAATTHHPATAPRNALFFFPCATIVGRSSGGSLTDRPHWARAGCPLVRPQAVLALRFQAAPGRCVGMGIKIASTKLYIQNTGSGDPGSTFWGAQGAFWPGTALDGAGQLHAVAGAAVAAPAAAGNGAWHGGGGGCSGRPVSAAQLCVCISLHCKPG